MTVKYRRATPKRGTSIRVRKTKARRTRGRKSSQYKPKGWGGG